MSLLSLSLFPFLSISFYLSFITLSLLHLRGCVCVTAVPCQSPSVFIHSFIPVISIAPLQQSSTTQRRSQLQHGYCVGVSHRSAQATVGKGLAQGPYVAARAGVEPTTLQLSVIASTNAPPCPTIRI